MCYHYIRKTCQGFIGATMDYDPDETIQGGTTDVIKTSLQLYGSIFAVVFSIYVIVRPKFPLTYNFCNSVRYEHWIIVSIMNKGYSMWKKCIWIDVILFLFSLENTTQSSVRITMATSSGFGRIFSILMMNCLKIAVLRRLYFFDFLEWGLKLLPLEFVIQST